MPLVPQGREIPCTADGLAPPGKCVLELDVVKATTGLCRTVADFVLVEVVLLVRGVEVVLLVLLSVEDVLLVRGVVVLLERGVEDVLLTVVSKLVALVRVVA